ncbi:MAG: VOC family protein, partial [Candidatus Entotheonellia bacterium]
MKRPGPGGWGARCPPSGSCRPSGTDGAAGRRIVALKAALSSHGARGLPALNAHEVATAPMGEGRPCVCRSCASGALRKEVSAMSLLRAESVNHVSIPVNDLERAKKFYIEMLGMQEIPPGPQARGQPQA